MPGDPPMTTIPEPFPDYVILLTGGGGRRLGGADKAAIRVGGNTLLDRAIRGACGRPVIIVGPTPDTAADVTVTREDPPGGGPAAGVAAGVAAIAALHPPADVGVLVAVQAVDQAGVTPDTWRRLTAAAQRAPGAVLTEGGRRQYGVGVFPLASLVAGSASRGDWHGAPLRELLDPLVGSEIDAHGDESRDIDTLEDLTWWRAHTDAPGTGGAVDERT
jgi:molybdopterin-guanine dinucleotide biosynthesis protein A